MERKHQILLAVLSLLLPVLLGALSRPRPPATDVFQSHREVVMQELRDMQAVAIFHSAPIQKRNDDVDYPYRQASDLYYLTGWEEPHTVLVLDPQAKQYKVILYVQTKDPRRELWTGPRRGVAAAAALPGVDTAYAYEQFEKDLPKLLYRRRTLAYASGGDENFEKKLLDKWQAAGSYGAQKLLKAEQLTAPLRLKKTPWEIARMERAVSITRAGLLRAMRRIPQLKTEYQVRAEIEYAFRFNGSPRNAFSSIVGSSANATILHYEADSARLVPHSLVLMDVGAEYGYYASDVTRTVPVDGSFSPAQREIYDLVLKAQEAAIKVIKPGVPYNLPHKQAVRVIIEGLVRLGFLTGEVDSLIAKQAYRRFFPHGTSHWVGLDVHDVGSYRTSEGEPRKLEPGMVLTVEPGIYIPAGSEGVPEKYWNIGVRIEDDVLVTKHGHRVLSAGIPKKVDEIEKIMNVEK